MFGRGDGWLNWTHAVDDMICLGKWAKKRMGNKVNGTVTAALIKAHVPMVRYFGYQYKSQNTIIFASIYLRYNK